MQATEVLIVGGGPVGLLLGIECARRGLAFRIVDAALEPSEHSKALAIWSAAQEVFSAVGVLDRMLAEGFQPDGMRFCSRRRTLVRLAAGEGVDSPHPRGLILPQSATERILIDRLGELGHAVERRVEFTALEQDAGGVTATLRRADGSEEPVRCACLVGCDGAHSAVRHAIGAHFGGRTRPETFVLCDAELGGPRTLPPEVHLFASARGPLPMFPIRDRLWRVVATRHGEAGTAPPTREEMQDYLDERGPGGLDIVQTEWLSSFRVSERQVDRFRVGRVLLAGDAAHIHSPAGGQGMNTGIQDAFNIGWKLAAILRQGCDAAVLLESYHAERAPAAARVIAEASLRTRVALLTPGPATAVRNFAASLLGRAPKLAARLGASLAGVTARYAPGGIVGDDAAWAEDWRPHGFAPGSRMRDATVFEEGLPVSLLSLALGAERHTLFLFSGTRPNFRDADAIQAVRASAAGYGGMAGTVAIWRGDHGPDPSWLFDPDGSAHRRFGVESPAACLVRPDGVVALRCQPAAFAPIERLLRFMRGSCG